MAFRHRAYREPLYMRVGLWYDRTMNDTIAYLILAALCALVAVVLAFGLARR